MKRETLTALEQQIVDAWMAFGLPTRPSVATTRRKLRATAFHEAGHVVARMFTDQEANHVVGVSILPDPKSYGRETSDRNFAETTFADYPPSMRRAHGRRLLIAILAGRGAEFRAAPKTSEGVLDAISLRFDGEGTDLFRARRIAEIMALPGMPARRILELAGKWTTEMLDLPAVWRAVETLAHLLLERGVIRDRDEIAAACADIMFMGLNRARWARRLVPSQAERRAVVLNPHAHA